MAGNSLKFRYVRSKIQLFWSYFSYLGACQLGLDVKFLTSWLHQSIVMESVQQSILDLPVLKTLGGVVLILMKQPYPKRSSSKFRSQVASEISE